MRPPGETQRSLRGVMTAVTGKGDFSFQIYCLGLCQVGVQITEFIRFQEAGINCSNQGQNVCTCSSVSGVSVKVPAEYAGMRMALGRREMSRQHPAILLHPRPTLGHLLEAAL